jgi:prevent-host-death family protein
VSTVSVQDAEAGLSGFIDDAVKGEFVTLTRQGKPVAALFRSKPRKSPAGRLPQGAPGSSLISGRFPAAISSGTGRLRETRRFDRVPC